MTDPQQQATSDPIVGIDLGTTNSLVAIADERGPRILTLPGDDASAGEPRMLPSVVRFSESGVVEAVGHGAKASAVRYPERTIASVKRLMGRSVRDAEADLPYLGHRVVEGPNNSVRIVVGERAMSPEEVSAVILRALKQRAEAALGREVRRAVVTVPAYFDDAQRQATRDAGRIAGLEVVRIVNEPTAAALAYGVGVASKQEQTIAVYDLGGGTFDVSILRVTPGDDMGADYFEVLATAGDTRLGGDDFDRVIIELVMQGVRERFAGASVPESELTFPPETRQALRQFAEQTKIRLSTDETAHLRIDLGAGRVFERTLTRDEFETMITPWVDRTIERCQRALRDAGLSPADIDRVVMVGGSTRVPLVRRRVGEFFGAEPYTALDPDLVVAMGVAVQASILSGENRSALLLDVLPLSLGLETAGGGVAKLVVRNTTVPTRATEMFSTSVDGQTSIKLHVVQGEREMVEDCRSLGVFHLTGLPPMPAGIPQLQVEFLVDANGVLNVSAIEKRSGKRAALQIVPNHGLTREEVERIEAESLEHAQEDMTRHRVADLVVNSRLDLKWIGERLDALSAELPGDYREELERKRDELTTMVEQASKDWRSVDANAFLNAKQSLDEASVRLHEISIAKSLREKS